MVTVRRGLNKGCEDTEDKSPALNVSKNPFNFYMGTTEGGCMERSITAGSSKKEAEGLLHHPVAPALPAAPHHASSTELHRAQNPSSWPQGYGTAPELLLLPGGGRQG